MQSEALNEVAKQMAQELTKSRRKHPKPEELEKAEKSAVELVPVIVWCFDEFQRRLVDLGVKSEWSPETLDWGTFPRKGSRVAIGVNIPVPHGLVSITIEVMDGTKPESVSFEFGIDQDPIVNPWHPYRQKVQEQLQGGAQR